MTLARGWECDRLLARWRTQRSMAENLLRPQQSPQTCDAQSSDWDTAETASEGMAAYMTPGTLVHTHQRPKPGQKNPPAQKSLFWWLSEIDSTGKIPWTTMTNTKSKFLQLSGASHKWAPSISPVTHTHLAGKCKSLSGTDAHLTPRGNLNISCSLSSSSLLVVPLSCPHHWPAVYKQFAPPHLHNPPPPHTPVRSFVRQPFIALSYLSDHCFFGVTATDTLMCAVHSRGQQQQPTTGSHNTQCLERKISLAAEMWEAEFSIIKCFKL